MRVQALAIHAQRHCSGSVPSRAPRQRGRGADSEQCNCEVTTIHSISIHQRSVQKNSCSKKQIPTNHGFDEWYCIPNTTDESLWTSSTGFDPKVADTAHPRGAEGWKDPGAGGV
jgi:hypothetical protein